MKMRCTYERGREVPGWWRRGAPENSYAAKLEQRSVLEEEEPTDYVMCFNGTENCGMT